MFWQASLPYTVGRLFLILFQKRFFCFWKTMKHLLFILSSLRWKAAKPSALAQRTNQETLFSGKVLRTSINPNPFFIRRGFRPLPKPLANLCQGA